MIRSSESIDFLCESVQDAVIAVLADVGLDLAPGAPCAGSALAGTSYLATIGFAGDAVRGALLLSASGELMRSILPEGLDADCPAMLADFLGELANMTAGRLKHEFLKRETTLLLATPTCATGDRLTLPPTSAGGESAWFELSSARGPIFVRIDALFALTFTLRVERPALVQIAEGDAIFF